MRYDKTNWVDWMARDLREWWGKAVRDGGEIMATVVAVDAMEMAHRLHLHPAPPTVEHARIAISRILGKLKAERFALVMEMEVRGAGGSTDVVLLVSSDGYRTAAWALMADETGNLVPHPSLGESFSSKWAAAWTGIKANVDA